MTKKVLGLILAMILLVGCAGGVKADDLIGEWGSLGGDQGVLIWIFEEDGKGTIDTLGSQTEFTYTCERGELAMTVEKKTVKYKVTISDGELTAISEDDDKTVLTFVKGNVSTEDSNTDKKEE